MLKNKVYKFSSFKKIMSKSKIIKAFYFPALVLLIHLVLVPLKTYTLLPWFDIPMHFLGGFAVALTSLSLLKLAKENNLIKLNSKIQPLIILSSVSLIATLWELFEFAIDHLTNFQAQLGLADTMLDLLMGLIGAISLILIKR